MEEKYLDISKHHVCYSKTIKKILLEYLNKKYKAEEVEKIFEKAQLQYVEFLKGQPYLGGKSCTHNRDGGTYDCIMMFALYEVLEEKPTLEEMYEMNNKAFIPPFERVGKIINANKEFALKIMNKAFMMAAKGDKKIEKDCPTGYIMDVSPYKKNEGIHYTFTRCPIAEFAKAHGYLDLMPAFCNGDYPGLKAMHAGLIREFTCANSNLCDYWIVGDKDPRLNEYPVEIDDKGYMRNYISKKDND